MGTRGRSEHNCRPWTEFDWWYTDKGEWQMGNIGRKAKLYGKNTACRSQMVQRAMEGRCLLVKVVLADEGADGNK